jgi:serine/threonine-protein kinase
MMGQVMGYGESLAKFMATQSAVPLLAEDWAAIEVFIQETMSRQNFPYLLVVDDEGTVRGSNDPAKVNAKYAAPPGEAVSTPDKSLSVQAATAADGRDVIDFGAPILFQGKRIGEVHLGLYEEPLSRVARLILFLLAVLTLVTIAAVAGGTWLLARRLVAPLKIVRNGLDELAAGRYDIRSGEQRSDEFGEVFRAFDRAAAALEARYDTPAPAAVPSDEGTIVAPAKRPAGTQAVSP